MTGREKSDRSIVLKKLSNKARGSPRAAETVEERVLAKGNLAQQNRFRTQCRVDLQRELGRVREAAKRDKRLRFTALWHHVYKVDRLREAYFGLKRAGAPGVDGQTWQQYGEHLEENLKALSARLKAGTYQAKPVRRAYMFWLPTFCPEVARKVGKRQPELRSRRTPLMPT